MNLPFRQYEYGSFFFLQISESIFSTKLITAQLMSITQLLSCGKQAGALKGVIWFPTLRSPGPTELTHHNFHV